MFKYSEAIGIKQGINIVEISTVENKILLIPDAICDTIEKINQLGFYNLGDVNFINGYIILPNGKVLNKKGQLLTFDKITFQSNFSYDIALCNRGYLIGSTGSILKDGKDIIKRKPFSEGVAPVNYKGFVGNNWWGYIDTKGRALSGKRFLEASCFFGGYAIVKVNEDQNVCWKIIDKNFNYIETMFFNGEKQFGDMFYQSLMYIFDNNPNLTNADPTIRKIQRQTTEWGPQKLIFIDSATNLSIRVHEVLEEISKKLGIKLIPGNAREQLVDIISKAALKGTFTLDLFDFEIKEVEIVKGVRIATSRDNSVVSFDQSDIAFIRTRDKKEETNA